MYQISTSTGVFVVFPALVVPSWRENRIEPLEVDSPNSIPEVRRGNQPSGRFLVSTFYHDITDDLPPPLLMNYTNGVLLQALDDNVYLKRHLKLELDEKRRKRCVTARMLSSTSSPIVPAGRDGTV